MDILDEYISRYIISFLDCEFDIYKVNKFFCKEYKCRKIDLNIVKKCLCRIHGDRDYFYSEKILNRYIKKKKISAIHFKNKRQLEIAKPFLRKIGRVSHYCCDNVGVMFITEDNKFNL